MQNKSDKNTPLVPKGVQDNEFSLASMYDPRSKIPPEQKMRAVMAYLTTGTSKQASKVCGINDHTIRWWKNSAEWWPQAVEACQKDLNDELDAFQTDIIHKAYERIRKAVLEGEEIYDRKTGQFVRVFPTARDLTWMAAVLQDKRNILRGQPNSIARKDPDQRIEELMKKFEEMSTEIRTERDRKVVSEQ